MPVYSAELHPAWSGSGGTVDLHWIKTGTTVRIRQLLIAHQMKKSVDTDSPADPVWLQLRTFAACSPRPHQFIHSWLKELVSSFPQALLFKELLQSHCRLRKLHYLMLSPNLSVIPFCFLFFLHYPTCKHPSMWVSWGDLPVFCTICSEKPVYTNNPKNDDSHSCSQLLWCWWD